MASEEPIEPTLSPASSGRQIIEISRSQARDFGDFGDVGGEGVEGVDDQTPEAELLLSPLPTSEEIWPSPWFDEEPISVPKPPAKKSPPFEPVIVSLP